MTKGTRKTLLVALCAAVLGAGELVAFQGIAPHARKLGDPGRVALRAGGIVARDLSALVVERAQNVASLVALHGVRQTSRIYRLAGRAFGVTEVAAPAAGDADRGYEAVMASEPDMPCGPMRGCEASASALSRAACPACPERSGAARPGARSSGTPRRGGIKA